MEHSYRTVVSIADIQHTQVRLSTMIHTDVDRDKASSPRSLFCSMSLISSSVSFFVVLRGEMTLVLSTGIACRVQVWTIIDQGPTFIIYVPNLRKPFSRAIYIQLQSSKHCPVRIGANAGPSTRLIHRLRLLHYLGSLYRRNRHIIIQAIRQGHNSDIKKPRKNHTVINENILHLSALLRSILRRCCHCLRKRGSENDQTHGKCMAPF